MAEVLPSLTSTHTALLDGPVYEPDLTAAPPAKTAPEKVNYNSTKHLAFEMPEVITMEEFGFAKDLGVSPVAASKPFQLFTAEAVEQMRQEVFDVRDNHPEHVFKSNIAACQLRGYVPK
jgi:hypothetical protein